MFNQSNTSVAIRLAQSGDKVAEVTVSAPAQEQTPASAPVAKEEVIKKPEVNTTTAERITDSTDVKRIESDQEKMVLDLFDGKYVE